MTFTRFHSGPKADAQTQALMVDCYQRLLKDEGRSEALREAKGGDRKPCNPAPLLLGCFRPHRQLDTSGGERASSVQSVCRGRHAAEGYRPARGEAAAQTQRWPGSKN